MYRIKKNAPGGNPRLQVSNIFHFTFHYKMAETSYSSAMFIFVSSPRSLSVVNLLRVLGAATAIGVWEGRVRVEN